MNVAFEQASKAGRWHMLSALTSPLALLAVALLFVFVLLLVPLRLPVGPMYWDIYIYYDAANRIFDGQIPVRDFFIPVGPLCYYLFVGWLTLFPNGHPVLLAHWSLLAITTPAMTALVWHVDKRSRFTAFALLIPFLIFALLPFDTRDMYAYPGSDGFGVYNRQVCQILYVLVAAFTFVRDRRLLAGLVAVCMGSLFFVKITGFLAAGLICAFALIAGRITLRDALIAAVAFMAILAGMEISSGLVGGYVNDIIVLVGLNSGTLVPRLLRALSQNFGVVLATTALVAVLVWADWRKLATQPGGRSSLFGRDSLWLAVVMLAGILFETQNTGSQAFFFLWPILLAILLKTGRIANRPALALTVSALVAATALPLVVRVVERAARTYVGAVRNVPLQESNLKTLGALNMRPEVQARSDNMLRFYSEHSGLYQDMADVNELPNPLFYSDFEFQIVYLKTVDMAIDTIRDIETRTGVRFGTIMSLNFVNPFPWLMERSAPLHITIGADPGRTVPLPGSAEEQAVANTDLILLPTCPPTANNKILYTLYEPALAEHRRFKLNQCYDAFVHPRFDKSLGLNIIAPN
ncbi:hypothetical protein [Mesorhizobium amorphae]|uniref:hypothetical protein n=1 Tax=Mesorhizobium amorphae TaxID=71433 RepID=UPI0028CBA01E|nr:hypothetical protein [Mesorhizobium amorphae]